MDAPDPSRVKCRHEHPPEILAELPRLDATARSQIFQRLCELQEADLHHGARPTPEERRVLDEALAEFRRDRDTGTPWREVIAHLAQDARR